MSLDVQISHNQVYKLLEDYYPRLVAYAGNFTYDKSAAEDVVQDSIIKFLKKYSHCSEEEFPKLIFCITRNCCLDYIKHKKVVDNFILMENNKGEMLYNFDFLGQETDENFLYEELYRQVEDVLSHLPTRCREVFEMSRFKNMSNAEISEALNISIKTVKNQITKALAAFKKTLSSLDYLLFLVLFF